MSQHETAIDVWNNYDYNALPLPVVAGRVIAAALFGNEPRGPIANRFFTHIGYEFHRGRHQVRAGVAEDWVHPKRDGAFEERRCRTGVREVLRYVGSSQPKFGGHAARNSGLTGSVAAHKSRRFGYPDQITVGI